MKYAAFIITRAGGEEAAYNIFISADVAYVGGKFLLLRVVVDDAAVDSLLCKRRHNPAIREAITGMAAWSVGRDSVFPC